MKLFLKIFAAAAALVVFLFMLLVFVAFSIGDDYEPAQTSTGHPKKKYMGRKYHETLQVQGLTCYVYKKGGHCTMVCDTGGKYKEMLLECSS